jgi:deoxyribodipyrimidine photo-lyase
MFKSMVPTARVTALDERVPDPDGGHVLYWMTSARRTRYNFALERAVQWAVELGRGLVVLEALRCDYPWASDRFHRFLLDGMADNVRDAQGREGVAWYPYIERASGEGRGLLAMLAATAAVVVTDDYPTFFIPDMLSAAAGRVPVRFEAVDSNGLAPMRGTRRSYPSAYTFRRYLQKSLPHYLDRPPAADPMQHLKGIATPALRDSILERWPSASAELSEGGPDLQDLPLDHSVGPAGLQGGARAAGRRLQEFLRYRLSTYAEERNHPDEDAASGLSPYLHFGHVSVHEILDRLAERETWTPAFEDKPTNGKRTGWWGMSPSAEAFLDQVVTWRELGFNMAANRPDHREYESLPDWARQTLEDHAGDPRPHLYGLDEFRAAATHDELWNAAQRQLLGEGIMHNYLRMLWGKKILEWTANPREAASVMIELNNRYAIDGRDPNSYSGIYWCLGRYDRPWGPERPVFGKIRYMTSRNTMRKLRLNQYLERFGG